MPLPRQRRYRAPRRWSEDLDNLHDYVQPPKARQVRPRSLGEDPPIIVTDDWPDHIPVTVDELRVIESHLAQELDRLFGPLP